MEKKLLENEIVIIKENGDEIIYTIIFTHEHEGKTYIVLEDPETGEAIPARYVATSDTEGDILDIETDEEYAMLDEVYNEFLESLEDDEMNDEE